MPTGPEDDGTRSGDPGVSAPGVPAPDRTVEFGAAAFRDMVLRAVHDPDRIERVLATGLLDTDPDDAFDALTSAACDLLDAPFGFITLVDDRRSYWKSCVGLATLTNTTRQNSVEDSFCQYLIGVGTGLTVDDVRTDARTCDNPSIGTMGVVAWAGQPIIATDGTVLGSVCVFDVRPRRWTDRDEAVLRSLAMAASRLVQLASRLAELEALRRRAEDLSAFTGQLAAHITTPAAIELILSFVPPMLDADLMNVALCEPGSPDAAMFHGPDVPDPVALEFASIPLSFSSPLTDAISSGRTISAEDLDDVGRRYPHLLDATIASGIEASVAVPLFSSDGVTLGALGLAWSDPVVARMVQPSILNAVASLCAQTIERTDLADSTNDLIRKMTLQLLPDAPPVRGLDIAVRYLPADDRLTFGGDWHDVIALSDSRTMIIVGDVVGHGIAAAARMAEIRGVLNTLTKLGSPLDQLLSTADELLSHHHDPYLATIALIEIDTDTNVLRHVSAGHPPILCAGSSGPTLVHNGTKRPPLGFGGAVDRVEEVPFPPGSAMVAYTDGLVECRGRTFDERIGELSDVIGSRTVDSDSSTLCADILATATSRSDDIAIVVITRLDAC